MAEEGLKLREHLLSSQVVDLKQQYLRFVYLKFRKAPRTCLAIWVRCHHTTECRGLNYTLIILSPKVLAVQAHSPYAPSKQNMPIWLAPHFQRVK